MQRTNMVAYSRFLLAGQGRKFKLTYTVEYFVIRSGQDKEVSEVMKHSPLVETPGIHRITYGMM